MPIRGKRTVGLLVLLAAACVAAIFIFNRGASTPGKNSGPTGATRPGEDFVRVSAQIEQVMGCDCRLTLYLPAGREGRFDELISAATVQLQTLEGLMSIYRPQSELAALNSAPAGREIALSDPVMDIMRVSQKFHGQTDGTFDVTCLPIIAVWRKAGRAGKLPDRYELAAAVALAGWKKIKLTGHGAIKLDDRAGADLGGIAKGYAVDRMTEALIKAGVPAGMVDLGGSSIRCFGRRPDGEKWRIAIRDPFNPRDDLLCVLEIQAGSLSVSGNYEKFVEIAGRRYSHIVDPRTGETADQTPSAVIVAPDATTAEAWSKPLSVLGEAGLKIIPAGSGIEAMIVVGDAGNHKIFSTAGFERLKSGTARPATQVASQQAN